MKWLSLCTFVRQAEPLAFLFFPRAAVTGVYSSRSGTHSYSRREQFGDNKTAAMELRMITATYQGGVRAFCTSPPPTLMMSAHVAGRAPSQTSPQNVPDLSDVDTIPAVSLVSRVEIQPSHRRRIFEKGARVRLCVCVFSPSVHVINGCDVFWSYL